MRKALAAIAVALAFVGTATVARGANGPTNKCYGQIAVGIATTWPWAHDDKSAFPPPPGSLPLWIQSYGADYGISSVRDLQARFCDE